MSNARGKGSKVFIFGTRPAGRSRYGSPNGGVAPSEQLNVVAALDQGTRLFLLQARYQDAGDVQAEYYLAGPHGISHQSLRTLFPLREWLAAHGKAPIGGIIAEHSVDNHNGDLSLHARVRG